jgi:hypothetical protein
MAEARSAGAATELKRSEVGKRVRLSAELIRRSLISIIDAAQDPRSPTEYVDTVRQFREDWKEAETALKDWDNLSNLEDSFDDLEWRQKANSTGKELLQQLREQIDQRFPEHVLEKKLAAKHNKRKTLASGNAGFHLGPLTQQTLIDLAEKAAAKPEKTTNTTISSGQSDFNWELTQCARTLVCTWSSLMKVTIRLAMDGEITNVRVIGENESFWPSEFDVFRELERQSKRELRDLMITPVSYDEISSELLKWFNDRRSLFQAQCKLSKRFLAFGAVGDHGELEARPPMHREMMEQSENPVVEASFDDSLL